MAPSVSERARQVPASPIRKLTPLADAAKRRGVNVYHLNIGQPDLETPAAMRAKLALAPSVLAYTPSAGTAECLDALAQYYGRLGITLTADELVVTTGGSEALLFALLACAGEDARGERELGAHRRRRLEVGLPDVEVVDLHPPLLRGVRQRRQLADRRGGHLSRALGYGGGHGRSFSSP